MGTALELLRPPAHRGPLIASGAVLVMVAIALEELRLADELATGWHLAILTLAAALMLALGLQARTEGGTPPASQSVLLVCGLLLAPAALLTLADVLGADFRGFPFGTLVWTSLIWTGVALWPAAAKGSSICALIAAFAFATFVLALVKWVFDANSATTYRWLLVLLAIAFVVVSLLLRGPAPRHSEQLVNAAGLAVLGIGLSGVLGALLVTNVIGNDGDGDGVVQFFMFDLVRGQAWLPNGWELLLLVAGCGLIAYGAVDRTPGPAYLGVVNLLVFINSAAQGFESTLVYWPLILLSLGLGAMAFGLRPLSPLPPEPGAYVASTVPFAARSGDATETVLRVRDDSPPSR